VIRLVLPGTTREVEEVGNLRGCETPGHQLGWADRSEPEAPPIGTLPERGRHEGPRHRRQGLVVHPDPLDTSDYRRHQVQGPIDELEPGVDQRAESAVHLLVTDPANRLRDLLGGGVSLVLEALDHLEGSDDGLDRDLFIAHQPRIMVQQPGT
jgi:hypothetical protein